MKCYFGIDVGGTSIKVGKFVNEQLVYKESFRTEINEDCFVLINQITDIIDSNTLEGEEIKGIGLGLPGPVVDGVVLRAQNIYWENVDLKAILSKKYPNCKIAVLNDANAHTLGEWYFGSSELVDNFVFVTIGTGIGGGVVINKKLITGADGSCGEVGHIKIMPYNGRPCSCGLTGCVEQYASATGIIKTTRYLLERTKDPSSNQFRKRFNTKDLFDAAREGNTFAISVVNQSAYYLAIALVNIANTINPDRIVIGGGVSNAKETLLNPVLEHFKKMAFYAIKKTEIQLATLQNDAGIYGCYYSVTND